MPPYVFDDEGAQHKGRNEREEHGFKVGEVHAAPPAFAVRGL